MSKRRHPRQRDAGFTLIELLVVVIVIGILASIAVSVFYKHRQRVWDAAVRSDLRNAATAQETFLTESNPGPFATSVAELKDVGFRPSSASNYYGGTFDLTVNAVASTSYCLTARSGTGTYIGLSSSGGWLTKQAPIDPVTCT